MFRELCLAGSTGYEINRFSDRHGNAEIEVHASMLTAWTGDFFQAVGDIRLGPPIKIHVGIHREIISTLEADGTAFPIGLQGSSVDAEGVRLANCAAYARQPFLNLFKRCVSHQFPLQRCPEYTHGTGASSTVGLRFPGFP